MPLNYCFYIHHHGAGHVIRAVTIAKELYADKICFMGSDLHRFQTLIPEHITCMHLPLDLPIASDKFNKVRSVSSLHYAPLCVQGIRERNKLMMSYFCDHPQMLLIVDVSVEVTMLARLCGIPTVVIRQHGRRGDLAHQLAYENAELIIAPYSETLSSRYEEGLFAYKTLFSGGFSRYTNSTSLSAPTSNAHLAIFVGHGGTRIDSYLVRHLRSQIPSAYHLHILGQLEDDIKLEYCTFHGHVHDPEHLIERCNIVICNAGHNTVMELADLRKRMICIPAGRPFEEQEVKCRHLQRHGLAIVVKEEDVFDTNWNKCIKRAERLDLEGWANIMNPGAGKLIAHRLTTVYENLFGRQQTNS